MVSQSEQLVAELSTSDSKDNNQYELEKRLRELNDWLHFNISPSSKSHDIKNDSNDERDNGKYLFYVYFDFYFHFNDDEDNNKCVSFIYILIFIHNCILLFLSRIHVS